MLWVAGCGAPAKMHATLEGAHTEAKRLRALPDLKGRAVYILAPIEQIAGRRIITIAPKPHKCQIEPATAGGQP